MKAPPATFSSACRNHLLTDPLLLHPNADREQVDSVPIRARGRRDPHLALIAAVGIFPSIQARRSCACARVKCSDPSMVMDAFPCGARRFLWGSRSTLATARNAAARLRLSHPHCNGFNCFAGVRVPGPLSPPSPHPPSRPPLRSSSRLEQRCGPWRRIPRSGQIARPITKGGGR